MRINKDEVFQLKELYARQIAYLAKNGSFGLDRHYLDSKFALDITLQRQIRVIDMFAPYIRDRVLEWGCQHGLDSCIFRMRFGQAVELYSCDVCPEEAYKPFQEFSRTIYQKLDHPYLLPYQDAFFDIVTSNGVLEHVPNDLESLKEIHRILKPGGVFVLTCLPNRYSYTEAIGKSIFRKGGHDRLYSMGQAAAMLRDCGFEVLAEKYFFMLPTMMLGLPRRVQEAYQKAVGRFFWTVNDSLERLWPLNRAASNLMLIARSLG